MICKKCGTKFSQGVFCPKCGEKITSESTDKSNHEVSSVDKELELLKQKNENLRLERERLTREQEMAKRDLDSRTVQGTVYKSIEEAEQAKREHNMIDGLRENLMSTKSQRKRKEIFEQFNEQIATVEVMNRYELLKTKVTRAIPISEKLSRIYGVTVLITFVVSMVMFSIIEGEVPLVGQIFIIWASFGIWIWPIWKIILFVKSKSKNYYKNLKNI